MKRPPDGTHVQIVKHGAECWHVTRTTTLGKNVHEYELIGRVLLDGGYYHVDLVEWKVDGYAWKRLEGRGYLIPKPAFRALVEYERVVS